MIGGRSLLRRDDADLGGIASVDGAPTGRVQARYHGHPSVAGRRRDNVPKGGQMVCGGSGGDKMVIERAWRWHVAGEWGRPKLGPTNKTVRKEGGRL